MAYCAKSVLAVAAAGLLLATAVSASAQQAGVASAVNPDALTQPPQQTDRTLVVGHDVVFNEKITTGGEGQAQLLMLDQSGLTIAPNSELVIDKFVYNPDTDTGEMALSLTRGLVRFVGGRLSKSGSASISTPVATMGVRGGIALVDVVSPDVVDVTLLYGDAVKGVTNDGRPFSLRRRGYFTRIETGLGASPPQPSPTAALAGALARLQGRANASGGAGEKPTDEGAQEALGESVDAVAELEPDLDFQIDAIEGDVNLFLGGVDPEGGAGEIEINDNRFNETVLGFGQTMVGGGRFTTGTRSLTVLAPLAEGAVADPQIGVFSPNNFAPGTDLFAVLSDGGQVLAAIAGDGPLNFSLNGIGDPDAVPNIFNAADDTLFLSSSTFNATAAAAIAAQNIQGVGFFNTDLTSANFDGVSGTRITLTGGTPLTALPQGQSFFEPNGDSRTTGLLPFSSAGQFQLPIQGVDPAETRTINPENITQTPVIVDWTNRKFLYVGSIFQGNDGLGGEGVTAIQAAVGTVVGGDGEQVQLVGGNVGSTHIDLNGEAQHLLHAGVVDGTPLGDPGTGLAVSLDGNRGILEGNDGLGGRQDPTRENVHTFGAETGAINIGNPGVGEVTEQLFVGVIAENQFGQLENLVSDPDAIGGLGSLTINRDKREMFANYVVRNEVGQNITLQTNLNRGVFFNNDLFAIAESSPSGAAFLEGEAPAVVLISGEAIGAPNPCECAFLHWGFTAIGQNLPGEENNLVSNIGAFFAGTPTPDIQMPISGGAAYAGSAYGTLATPGVQPVLASGAFNLNVDFATGISTGDMNLAQENFAIVGVHSPGNSKLTVDYIRGAQIVGEGKGAFFGNQAANVAATININDGAGTRAAGIVVGEK